MTTNTYFSNCFTVEEIKARYRDLARKNHPDLGGSTQVMQDINEAYEKALKGQDGKENIGTDGKTHRYTYNEKVERLLMVKISEILSANLAGTDVYLIGTWLWVTGDTKPHSKALGNNGLGLRYHGKRKCWYLNPTPSRGYRSSANLDELAKVYGCDRFSKENQNKTKALR